MAEMKQSIKNQPNMDQIPGKYRKYRKEDGGDEAEHQEPAQHGRRGSRFQVNNPSCTEVSVSCPE
jgi:hypothetical protein